MGDLENILEEEKSPVLLKYLDNDFTQRLSDRQAQIDKVSMNYANSELRQFEGFRCEHPGLSFFKLKKMRILLGHLFAGDSSGSLKLEVPPYLFRQILKSAQSETESWQGRLYFVYLPAWHRYANLKDKGIFISRRENVLSMVRSLNIPVIDFQQVMDSHRDPLSLFPFKVHGHYTPEGYALLADLIAKYLEEDG